MKDRLFNRHFGLLWFGQAVSQLGNGAGFIATMWWIQSRTGSAAAIGTLALIQTLVAVLLSPFAGVVVDRLDRKAIIVGTDAIRGLVYAFFAYHAFRGTLTLPILYVGAGINSACAQFFGPAVGASVPLLVAKSRLHQANSLRQMTDQIASIFSYGLGGLLVVWLGVPLLLLVDAVTFILSALSELFIVIPRVTTKVTLTAKLFMDDLKDGIAYARSNGVLFRLLQILVFVNFCFVPFFLLLPKYVAEHLQAGSHVYGYITSAQMLGMLAGTTLLATTKIAARYPWLMRWGIALQALGFLVSPLLPRYIWGAQLVVYALFGFLNSVINIIFFTTLQRKVPQVYMGKTLSLVTAMVMGAQPVASALSGYLADRISLPVIFVGAALLGIISNLFLITIPGLIEFFDVQPVQEQSPRALTQ